jgi:hypothetical protein
VKWSLGNDNVMTCDELYKMVLKCCWKKERNI